VKTVVVESEVHAAKYSVAGAENADVGAEPPSLWPKRWLSAWVVVPFLVAAVLISRVPAIHCNEETNVDESVFMAQVMRLAIDPVPWRGMDGTTSGPVNTWALALIHQLGVPMEYAYVHAYAAVILGLISVLIYATFRQIMSRLLAFGGAAVGAAIIVLREEYDFIHYSSELVPCLLMAGSLLCIALRFQTGRRRLVPDFCAGLLLGMMPWAKLQSILGAGAVIVWLGWQILSEPCSDDGSRLKRLHRLLIFILAAAVPTIIILGIVIRAGAFDDFWMSYLKANLAYGKESGFAPFARRAILLCFEAPNSGMIQGTAIFGLAWLWKGRPGWKSASVPVRKVVWVTVCLAVANGLGVLKPCFTFPHYQIFLIEPCVLLAGCMLAIWAGDRSSPPSRTLGVVLFASCMAGFQITNVYPALRNAAVTLLRPPASKGVNARRMVQEIRSVAPGAKSMVVWGWMPSLYVESGIPPATRHTICLFLIEPGPARSHLRAGFLADIRREKPDVIVDAMAGGCFLWRDGWDTKRLSYVPELDDYVRQNYEIVSEKWYGLANPEPVRFYVSREYLVAHRQ